MKMLRCAVFAILLFAIAPAFAQWQTLTHSVPIGEGIGVTGFNSASPGSAGQPLVSNGAAADPSFQSLTPLIQDNTNQTAACDFYLSQHVATGPITYTLPRADSCFSGFGFWIYAVPTGGGITITPNAADNFVDLASGVSITLNPGSFAWISTNAASTGIWYTVVSQFYPGLQPGAVNMTRRPNSYVWTVLDGNGNVVNTASSTTGGLQEAINTAAAQGLCLKVFGGGQTFPGGIETDNATIFASTTISFPASAKACWDIDGVSLEMLMTTASNDGVTFDSWDMSNIRFRGQIIYSGTGAALHLLPTNPNQESFTGGTAGTFDFGSVVCVISNSNLAPDGSKGVGFRISAPAGTIDHTHFSLQEINGCNVGMQIDNPTNPYNVQNDSIFIGATHSQNTVSWQIGTGASGAAIFGNLFSGTLSSNGQAINDWSQSNTYNVAINAGTVGITLNTSAAGSVFITSENAASTPFSDGSTAKNSVQIVSTGITSAAYTAGTAVGLSCSGSPSSSFASVKGIVTHC